MSCIRRSCSLLALTVALGMSLMTAACSYLPFRSKESYLNRGNQYMAKGKYNEASIEYRKALQLDPRYVDALAGLAHADISIGQWEGAFSSLEQASTLAPQRLDLHLELGRIHFEAKEYPEAEQEASSILRSKPDDPMAQELMAASLLGEGKTDDADAAFTRLVQIDPQSSSAHVNLALIQSSLKQYAGAEENLRQAVALDPKSVQACLDLANLYWAEKEDANAERLLQQAIAQNPTATALYTAWADKLYTQQKAGEAEELLSRLRDQEKTSVDVAMALGDFYTRWNQPQQAVDEYKRALSLDPKNKNNEADKRLEDAYLNNSQLSDAETLNQQLVSRDPRDVEVQVARGRILLLQDKADDAIAILRKQTTEAPDFGPAHYYLGVALWKKGDLAQAKGELEIALSKSPDSVAALHDLAAVNLAAGNFDVAEEYARRAVAARPANADEYLLLSGIYLRENNVGKARDSVNSAKQLAPGNAGVDLALANVDMAAQNWNDANSALEAALKLQPRNTEVLSQLANLYTKRGQVDQGVARVQQYLAAYPDDAAAHALLGALYVEAKDDDAAAKEFQRSTQLDPKLASAYLRLGNVYEQQGKIAAAISNYQQALALQSNSVVLRTLIGNLYLKQNQYDVAEKYYQQALADDPDFGVAASNLAWIYLHKGENLNVALSLAQQAKRLLPDLDSVTDTLALAYYKEGLFNNALPMFQECVRKSPGDPVYRYHLGLALLASGEKAKGREALESALHMNLQGDDAAEAQRELTGAR